MMGVMGMVGTVPPHVLLKDIETKIASVKKAEVDGKTTFEAELTPEAAATLARGRGRGNRNGGEGNAGGNGKALFVIGSNGAIESIKIAATTTITFGEESAEVGRNTAYSIFDQGNAEVKVPDEAKTKLEEV